jgi:hypothetical protein
MKIKNWSKFQHFKDRRPPWVKLYRDLLDDIEWHELDPLSSKVLVTLWLLASEDEDQEGNLPNVKTIAWRLRLPEKQVLECVSKLSHWLEHDDINTISTRYQDDAPETETETETKKEKEPPRKRVDVVCPDSVDQQVWSDFVQHRKAKRSAITQTALEGIQQEAAKAGWTLEQALRETVARGWTGFKADWVNSNEQKQAKSFAQQERELGWKRWEEMTGRQHPDRLASEGISQGQVIDVSGNFLEIEQ